MTTITGRCLCGYVAYEYEGAIGPANYCHCADCRRVTGSAFNVGVQLERARLRFPAGRPKAFTKRGDSGNEITRHFCPDCGSPIFTSAPRHPDHVFVKAGTLDDPSVVLPTRQIWTTSAVAWAALDPALPSYPKGSS
jgi:hypothetical protein